MIYMDIMARAKTPEFRRQCGYDLRATPQGGAAQNAGRFQLWRRRKRRETQHVEVLGLYTGMVHSVMWGVPRCDCVGAYLVPSAVLSDKPGVCGLFGRYRQYKCKRHAAADVRIRCRQSACDGLSLPLDSPLPQEAGPDTPGNHHGFFARRRVHDYRLHRRGDLRGANEGYLLSALRRPICTLGDCRRFFYTLLRRDDGATLHACVLSAGISAGVDPKAGGRELGSAGFKGDV